MLSLFYEKGISASFNSTQLILSTHKLSSHNQQTHSTHTLSKHTHLIILVHAVLSVERKHPHLWFRIGKILDFS